MFSLDSGVLFVQRFLSSGSSQVYSPPAWSDIGIDFFVHIVDEEIGVSAWGFVESVNKCYDQPWKTDIKVSVKRSEVTGQSFTDILASIAATAEEVRGKSDVYDRSRVISNAKTLSADALQGIINADLLSLQSVTSNWATDSRGNIVFNSHDESSAMMLTGRGFMIANKKSLDGEWLWRTAGTGDGFTADVINAGVLNAGLVQILGTDQFYWDADNIYIYDTSEPLNQIRIGRYNGIDYGIGYTKDGGATWLNAIGFNGVNFTAISSQMDGFGERLSETEATLGVFPDQITMSVNSSKIYRADSESDLLTQLQDANVTMYLGLLWLNTTTNMIKKCTLIDPLTWQTVRTDEVKTSSVTIKDNSVELNSTGKVDLLAGSEINIKSTGDSANAVKLDKDGIALSSTGKLRLLSTDSIEIGGTAFNLGGTNLIKQSDLRGEASGWVANQDATITTAPTYTRTVINQNTSTPGIKSTVNVPSSALEEGKEYTLSIRARGVGQNVNCGVYIPCGNSHIFTFKKNVFETHKKTFVAGALINNHVLIYPETPDFNLTYDIQWIKLEKGNVATDWSPAPEDSAIALGLLGSDLSSLETRAMVYYSESAPSVSWTTAKQKTDATGALWYKPSDKKLQRWNGATWDTIEDQAAVDAIASAQTAWNLANSKVTIFSGASLPVSSGVKVGDLWLYTGTDGEKYKKGAYYRASVANASTDAQWFPFSAGEVLTPFISIKANELHLKGGSSIVLNNMNNQNAVIMDATGVKMKSGSTLELEGSSKVKVKSNGTIDLEAGSIFKLLSGSGDTTINMDNSRADGAFLMLGGSDPASAPFVAYNDGTIKNVGNSYVQTISENADSTRGVIMDVFFPDDVSLVDKVLLSVKLSAFRAYSTGAAQSDVLTSDDGGGAEKTSRSGGGTTKTLSISDQYSGKTAMEFTLTSVDSSNYTSSTGNAGTGYTGNPSKDYTGDKASGATDGPNTDSTSTLPSSYNDGSGWASASVEKTGSTKPLVYGGGGFTDSGGNHNHGAGTYYAEPHTHSLPSGADSHYHTIGHKHTLSGHTHDISGTHFHSLSTHQHTGPEHNHSMTHKHDIGHTHKVAGHQHVIDHSHELTLSGHSHIVDIDAHSHTVPAHGHGIVYGIYEGTTPTRFSVYVDGVLKLNSVASVISQDIATYFSKTSNKITRNVFHTVDIRPNVLGRVSAHLYIKTTQISKVAGTL